MVEKGDGTFAFKDDVELKTDACSQLKDKQQEQLKEEVNKKAIKRKKTSKPSEGNQKRSLLIPMAGWMSNASNEPVYGTFYVLIQYSLLLLILSRRLMWVNKVFVHPRPVSLHS